ncbi:hypothetical protein Tco_0940167 [Tanacetum coccineum]|uniref:Tf2-1-like SH3-like domain-containing protein n=1 Tax=Tanacetum coccineum TaxID=301880 RepID=A0ABQ5DML9_9ASTR
MVFHKMETEEISDRFMAPYFINGLKAYDGEINLGVEENMISNEFAVKLCLEHEVKHGNKVVKKELIIALRGEIYFVKFIINPNEDNVEPSVVFGRSFLRLTKAIVDFGNETVTIYPEIDPFLVSSYEEKIEEVEREALAISIYERYSILEEERPVIETMAYSDKYKKILDEICVDKRKLDGMNKEEEEAIIRIKGETLIEKDDPGAFVIPIRLEGKINLNTLVDTGSYINVIPYRIYKELDIEEVQNVKKGISMLNHSKAELMGLLSNVLCQVGVTTIIAKFLILDMPIDRDTPILVGRGFLHICGGIVNTIENITSTFDGICHQTYHAAKTSLDTTKSDSDDEEEYEFQRNRFGALIYEQKLARYLNCSDQLDRSLALQEVMNPFRKICVWKKVVSFLGSLPVALQYVEWKPNYIGCFNKKEDNDGQWHAEIKLTDPYENIYDQDNSKEWNSGDDQLRLRWMIYLVILADATESVRDAIGFEYCLASSSGWTKSPVLWAEIGESSLTGLELVQETIDKVVLVKEKPKTERYRQKSYVDYRHKPLEFEVGDRVLLKVTPWKGVVRFGKNGKLAPRYVGPFKIPVERMGLVGL